MSQTVVIIIDALGFELAQRCGMHLAGMPVRVRLETVLGFSQAALTSIAGGVRPNEHGLWMMYSFDPAGSPFRWMKALPGSISAERLWLRRLIRWKLESVDDVKSYYSLYHVPREVFPYLGLPARSNLFAPGGGGAAPTIFDEMHERGLRPFIRDYRTPEEIAFDDLERALSRREAPFYLLYTAGLDELLHRFGSGDARVAERLEWYRGRIERIFEKAQASGGETDFFVFGDHGMCDVERHVDIIAVIEDLGLAIPDDYIPFYDSTMARFKVISGKAQVALTGALSGAGGGRILPDGELERLGVYFQDGRFGDIIYLADPGTIILPSYMGTEPVAAMHGYHPSAACMPSVLLTNREIGGDGRSICDLAPLLLRGFEAEREGRRR